MIGSNQKKYLFNDISELKINERIIDSLRKNNITHIIELENFEEADLKMLPGIGYASARKIIDSYEAYIEKFIISQQIIQTSKDGNNYISNSKNSFSIHPVIEKTKLEIIDKEIMSFLINGYSLQDIANRLEISMRNLRQRLNLLKLHYQAKTNIQLTSKIYEDVLCEN